MGYYAGAEKINAAAVGLLSPLSTALYPRSAALVKDSFGKAVQLTKVSLYVMAAVGVALMLIMWFGSNLIVSLILGRNFQPSSGVFSILSLRAPMVAWTNVLGFQWLLALGLEKSFQRILMVALVLNFSLAALLAPRFTFIGMAWAVVASQATVVIGIYFILRRRHLNPLTMGAEPCVPESLATPSCSVLVMSCDAYSDLWQPFFNLFWRHWSDCPWPVFLGANQQAFPDSRIVTLKTGDAEWSRRLRFCLEQIDSDFVLLLLEDYFLDRPVSTPLISEKLTLLAALGGSQLRLFPAPGPDRRLDSCPELGLVHRRASYRVSTQAAIWKRGHLLDILEDGESIWHFEWNGTIRSRSSAAAYYATYKPLVHYRHVVERGEWFRGAAQYFGDQQIGCDFTARPIISRKGALKRFITTKLRNWNTRIGARLLALR